MAFVDLPTLAFSRAVLDVGGKAGLCQDFHGLVKKLRGQVSAVLPNNGLQFRINSEGPECREISQRLEDFSLQFPREIHFTLCPIVEADPDDVIADLSCFSDMKDHGDHSKGSIGFWNRGDRSSISLYLWIGFGKG